MKEILKYFGIGIIIIIASPIVVIVGAICFPFIMIYIIGRSFYENYCAGEIF